MGTTLRAILLTLTGLFRGSAAKSGRMRPSGAKSRNPNSADGLQSVGKIGKSNEGSSGFEERPQRLLRAADPGMAVSAEQVVPIEVEQVGVAGL